jgi:dTDP-glucose 4,6-dehydratase
LELLYQLIELMQKERSGDYRSLIRFVKDRPGHDFRYAIDTTKIRNELGWHPRIPLREGLKRTIAWHAKLAFLSQKI